jgi:hypothetical protein
VDAEGKFSDFEILSKIYSEGVKKSEGVTNVETAAELI